MLSYLLNLFYPNYQLQNQIIKLKCENDIYIKSIKDLTIEYQNIYQLLKKSHNNFFNLIKENDDLINENQQLIQEIKQLINENQLLIKKLKN
jgi:hypothetical protein